LRSVTNQKLNKIAKRNIAVKKSQALARLEKRAKLKLENDLKRLEELAFIMSHPVERLKKSPPLEYTRHLETVKRALERDMNVAREEEFKDRAKSPESGENTGS
jgi:hypothetical protein